MAFLAIGSDTRTQYDNRLCAASGDSAVTPKSEDRQLMTAWVRGALELPAPVRRGWLQSTTRDREELMSDAETLLAIASNFTTSELETAAESGEESTSPAQRENFERRPVVGQRLAHYDLVSWLGAGGMGEVFRARDTALGRDAALKLIPRQFTTAMRLRLLREAEASAKLQHPAIATFYEAGEDAGEAFIAMSDATGSSLDRTAQPALNWRSPRSCTMFRRVAWLRVRRLKDRSLR